MAATKDRGDRPEQTSGGTVIEAAANMTSLPRVEPVDGGAEISASAPAAGGQAEFGVDPNALPIEEGASGTRSADDEPAPESEPERNGRKGDVMATQAENMNKMGEEMRNQSEKAMAQGRAAFEQAADRTRESMDRSLKAMDEMGTVARENAEALAAVGRAAAHGFEALAQQAAEFARKSFEDTNSALRTMASAKTPGELFQLQNDFAKAQFDAAVQEVSKLSETMMKVMSEVMEPISNRIAVTSDKVRNASFPK